LVWRERRRIMIYCFELDGTICTREKRFTDIKPYLYVIDYINKLFSEGHVIKIYSSRTSIGGRDWRKHTGIWLKNWGVKYNELVNGVPECDVFVSSKALSVESFREQIIPPIPKKERIGFVCSCFDLLHAGHFIMLEDSKSKCDRLIAGLQTDPTIDREDKNAPAQSLEERQKALEACRYVDEIRLYDTEKSLIELLLNVKPDIRILGSDWEGKEYTGKGIAKEEYFHDRSIHSYSTSNLRKKIYEQEKKKYEN